MAIYTNDRDRSSDPDYGNFPRNGTFHDAKRRRFITSCLYKISHATLKNFAPCKDIATVTKIRGRNLLKLATFVYIQIVKMLINNYQAKANFSSFKHHAL